MMQNRTHTCGELRLGDVGKQVKISGWMENVRVVSANLAFVVVRDFYGTTQVVAETEDMVNTFKAITKESTISVEGTVRERDSKTDKMATGDIEIVPAKVEVLGRCQHSEGEQQFLFVFAHITPRQIPVPIAGRHTRLLPRGIGSGRRPGRGQGR